MGTAEKYLVDNAMILSSIQPGSLEDRAYGCIMGAFIGDACGAFLEFANEIASEELMDTCMQMPGGGVWAVGPG